MIISLPHIHRVRVRDVLLIGIAYLSLACGVSMRCSAQALPTHLARERTYDVLHYRLNIDIDEQNKVCEGDVTITLIPLRPMMDSLLVDAGPMEIQKVDLVGKLLQFQKDSESIHIRLDKAYSLSDTLRLQISYRVTAPDKGLYFITPDSGYPNKQYQVWSQGQPEENHYWFPCYDYPNDKATSEVIVTVRDKFVAISNGALSKVQKNISRHTTTYHWNANKPFSSYLISIIVGEYTELQEVWQGIPIQYFVYPGQKDLAVLSFSKTKSALEYFSEILGYRYPWEKYSQAIVQDFMYSGMENLSATTLTDGTIHDERAHLDVNSDGLMAHELAHQWWGDLVTPRDWSHAWLSEGFATYFQMLFEGHDRGNDELEKDILDVHRSLLASDVGVNRRPTVWNHYNSPSDIYDNRIYGKGAAILHMLRFQLGDELFWKCIRAFLDRYKFGLVETNDFKLMIEDETGYNLDRFFRQWVYQAGYPDLFVRSAWDSSSHSLRLTIRQTQEVDSLTGVFETPVDIQLWIHNKPVTYRIEITKPEDEFAFPAYQQPQLVLFDKGNHLLKRIDEEKNPEEWLYQLRHAESGIDRVLAIDELRWFINSDSVFQGLSRALLDDRVWYVRQAAAYAVGGSKRREASEILRTAYGDIDARVRTAVIASLGNYKDEDAKKTIVYAFSKDLSYYTVAAALHSLRAIDSSMINEYCMTALQRDSYHEIIRTAALTILSDLSDSAIETVKSYLHYGIPRELRLAALTLLARKWGDQNEIVDYIITFLTDPGFHLRRTAIILLGATGNERALSPLQAFVETEPDNRLIEYARESIKKIQENIKKGK